MCEVVDRAADNDDPRKGVRFIAVGAFDGRVSEPRNNCCHLHLSREIKPHKSNVMWWQVFYNRCMETSQRLKISLSGYAIAFTGRLNDFAVDQSSIKM